MSISDKHFTEFKRIFKEEFGEEEFNKRTEQELFEEATKLVSLMEVVYKHQNTSDNQPKIDKAYDILFEEALKNETMKKETLKTLWEYCISKNRVCPMPMKWNDLFNLLKDNKELSPPLILNGWEISSPLEKNLRFKDHIKSAEDTNQIEEIGEYIRLLKEDDWAHYK